MDGNCGLCLIEGCISCQKDDPHACAVCRNGLVAVSELGTCECPTTGMKPNTEGICETCNVGGCSQCAPGQPDICAKCQDCKAYLSAGSCQCPFENAVFDSKGYCVTQSAIAQITEIQAKYNSFKRSSLTSHRSSSTDCDDVSDGCLYCDDGICLACDTRYFLSGGSCLRCRPLCVRC